VSTIERVLPAERATKLLASGLCFALADLVLKLLIHGVWGEYGEWDFRAGAFVGFFAAVVVGMILAVPVAVAEAGRAITLALAIVVLTYDAFAYSTYADTGHLPTVSSLFAYATSADARFILRGAGLGALASLGYGVGVPLFEARLGPRMASWGTRVADFVTILLFALFGLGTLVAGSGPVYYGIINPLVHLAVGRIQESPDPLPESANVHHHQHRHDHGEERRHEHGFVPEESSEPFPADGIPRPAESMRLQYQGLLGSEAFLPIEDTAFPFCRRETRASLTRPHDVVVVDLSGASAKHVTDALSAVGASRRSIAFDRVHAASTDASVGRRALITGIPPTVARRFTPDAPGLPSPPLLPRLPSVAESLRGLGVRTAYLGPDPGAHGTTRLELANLGFETLSYGAEGQPSASASDLETLTRLRAHLDRSSNAPRFAFVELRSFAEGSSDTRVLAALAESIRARRQASFVLTSDHVAQSDTSPSGAEFVVPFVVVADALPDGEGIASRLGAAYDLPQTVLGLLGSANRFCHQGRNLLAVEEPFPSRRVAFAQIGEGDRSFVLTESRDGGESYLRWTIDGSNPFAAETPASLYDLTADPGRKNDLFSKNDPDWPQMDELWKSHLGIGAYLLRTDRFVRPSDDAARVEPRSLVSGDEVVFSKVERIPGERGHYLLPVEFFDRGGSLDEALSARPRGSVVVLDLRAGRFGTHDALETWLGKHAAAVDGLLFDDVGMAIAHAERSKHAVGVWLRPDVGDRGSHFEQLARAGIDFLMMPLATDSAVRRAKQQGLEVWVPRGRAASLEDAKPSVIVD
jgi:hypothetical protein